MSIGHRRSQLDLVSNLWQIGSQNILGYVPQDKGLLDSLTVRQTLELYYSLYHYSQNRICDNNTLRRHELSNNSFKSCFSAFLDQIVEREDTVVSQFRSLGIIPCKYLDYLVCNLSGGNKKKLSIAVSNIGNPNLLLLDECTTGVDPLAADKIVKYLHHRLNSVEKGSAACQRLSNDAVAAKLTSSYTEINRKAQAMLFASHRIDECSLLCDRAIILHQGEVFFNGNMQAFTTLATRFYQVDITLFSNNIARPIKSPSNTSSEVKNMRVSETTSQGTPVSLKMKSTPLSLESSTALSSPLFVPSSDIELTSLHESVSSSPSYQSKFKLKVVSDMFGDGTYTSSNEAINRIIQRIRRYHKRHSRQFKLVSNSIIADNRNEIDCIDRVLEYSPTFIRLTFERETFPISLLWKCLCDMKANPVDIYDIDCISRIDSYSFREMNMEEALANIIATTNKK